MAIVAMPPSNLHPLSSHSLEVWDATAETVVIGGGPIGLWTAIQMKLLNPELDIAVVEKYTEYTRFQELQIDANSLKGVPHHPKLKALIQSWGNKKVPVQRLQKELAELTNELGIKLLLGKTAVPTELATRFPAAKVIVAADGARSKIREVIFNNELRFNTKQQYLAQVDYFVQKDQLSEAPKNVSSPTSLKINKTTTKIKNLSESYRMMKFAEHFIEESIKPQADGSHKVSLRVFIDEETYKPMVNATFSNPYTLANVDNLPKKLKKVLIRWWGTREEIGGQKIVIKPAEIKEVSGKKIKVGGNQITAIALESHGAKNFVKVTQDNETGRKIVWALAGDAGCAFPFFRAINNGFMLSTHLAKIVGNAFKNRVSVFQNDASMDAHFKSYQRYAVYRSTVERIRASVVNFFLNAIRLFIRISNQVPWQVNVWTKKQKQDFHTRGLAIIARLQQQPVLPAVA